MSPLFRSAIMVLVGMLIFVGLPIIGWGITDLAGFIDNPARVGYILITALLQIFVVIQFTHIGHTGGKGTKLVQRQQIAILLLQVISLAMVIAVPYTDHHAIAVIGGAGVLRYIGLAVFACGFLMMNWSEDSLGQQFSVQVTIQENHQLIQHGPYRLLRHPRYLGIILFNLGLALVFRSGLGLGLVVALMGVLLWRIHDEEILLRQAFGAEWDTYAQKSWRLIPYVY